MMDEKSAEIAVYRELQKLGADAQEIYARALADGHQKLAAIRVIRNLFTLSLEGAKEIVDAVEGRPPDPIRSIANHKDLVAYLRTELGYCGCAHFGAALHLLRETLAVADRALEAIKARDQQASDRATAQYQDLLGIPDNPGLATWFLYFLDHRDLIEHGGNVMRSWISSKGGRLLEAMRKYSEDPAATSV
jgi:hypothetical protein